MGLSESKGKAERRGKSITSLPMPADDSLYKLKLLHLPTSTRIFSATMVLHFNYFFPKLEIYFLNVAEVAIECL